MGFAVKVPVVRDPPNHRAAVCKECLWSGLLVFGVLVRCMMLFRLTMFVVNSPSP